jgi:O-antigen ligase
MAVILTTLGVGGSGQPYSTAQATIIGCTFIFVLVLAVWGTRRGSAPRRLFGFLVVLVTLSGLPGLASSGQIEYSGMIFFTLLAVRNYICFWGIPASVPASHGRAQRAVLIWTLAATTVVAVGSLLTAQRLGVSLGSSIRLTGENHGWLNANTTGVYCAFGILICLIVDFFPAWIRLSIGILSAYCLILSQSRTAIVALLLAAITFMMLSIRRKQLPILLALSMVLIMTGAAEPIFEQAQSTPAVSAVIDRFTGARFNVDKTNRMETIEKGIALWESEPVFGVGYGRDDTHFENAFLSIACESGALGLSFYLMCLGLVLKRAWALAYSNGEDARQLGKWLIAISVFILVHGLGERSHAFQIASPVSNCFALLSALAFRVACRSTTPRGLRTLSVGLTGLRGAGFRRLRETA